VLDGIPFGSARGVVSNGYCESKAVAELALQFRFPGAGTATVTAASIGQDEQMPAAAVAVRAVALHQSAMEWAAKAAVSCETPTRLSLGWQVGIDAIRIATPMASERKS